MFESHHVDLQQNNYRNFHRLVVKHNILDNTINKTENKYLLDLASGRGGDIPRYFEFNLKRK